MNALLCVALLVPGYGEKDILKAIGDAGGMVQGEGSHLFVRMAAEMADVDLDELCELRSLRYLVLPNTAITDNGVRTVSKLKWLTLLTLHRSSITDRGLRHLESMSNLRVLHLVECLNITDEGVARLQRALPNCVITR
jgi:hypothetical protein